MRYIQDYNFKDKKALIRVDFNVPLNANLAITDSTRIDKTLPTILQVLKDGGSAILISHLGRPKKGYTDSLSLKHLIPYLSNKLNTQVSFASDCIGIEAITKAQNLKPGEVLLLENLRFQEAEEQGEAAFAQQLAALGDVYINDAFGAAHREHASTYQITHYIKDRLAGYLLQEEINNANKLLKHIKRPFTVIIGGTKIGDKLQAVEALLGKLDNLLIGGGVANTFQQALGGKVGKSITEPDQHGVALNILYQAIEKGINLVLPTDVVIADQWSDRARIDTVLSDAVPENWMALDIGPHAQELFQDIIQKSKTILWTGPIGAFEFPSFSQGTQATIAAVAKATQKGAFSLIGGGDSATAVAQFGYTNRVSYISTGGGALLAYLANPNLPVIKVLGN
ncbi:MAG: phosphoglycerate kinase [Candidatus Amoebophilus sp. 36-38]|nr:MAG: phosphoglycerate kinase [Candidatus Amoebophilus sp. 36-38]